MKNNLKNSFFKEKLYISLNSSICKNPILNIKKFHPIKTVYSPINTTKNIFKQNETENKDIDYILKERKKGSYKISSKRNFKTIIFQNWNTKNNIPNEIGNCLNFPVIMDKKQIIKNSNPNTNNIIDINNIKYEYYYPVSNRKDLLLPSEMKEEKKRKYKKYHSHDKGWKLITNYFYKNKKERDKKRQLLKMKLTAKNLSIIKNKEKIKEDKKIENDIGGDGDGAGAGDSKKKVNKNENEKNKNENKIDKNTKNDKIIKENNIREKSKISIKTLDIEQIEEKRNKRNNFNKDIINTISNASLSISDNYKYIESQKTFNNDNYKSDLLKNENNIYLDNNNNYINQKITDKNEKTVSDLDKSIDWETFEDYKNLENNEFLYAIKKGKPLSYYLADFKELKKINQIEMKEKYYKHKLNKTNSLYAPKHSQDIFIINYMTISSENVIIYVNGKPENYNINEFKSIYLNYKTLTNIPLFKYWTRSKIFKLWLNYVQRQRRKKYEKKLKERLHILDKPIVEGIMDIKKIFREVKNINIFRLNSKEAKYPNQFIIDYQNEIIAINKEFEYHRNKIKEIIKNMCEEEVYNFMVLKKMLNTKALNEDFKLLQKIENEIKDNNKSNNNKENKDDNNKDKENKDKDNKDDKNKNISKDDKNKNRSNNDDKNKNNSKDDKNKNISKDDKNKNRSNNDDKNKNNSKDNNINQNVKNNDNNNENNNNENNINENNNENENNNDEEKEIIDNQNIDNNNTNDINNKLNYKLNQKKEILKNLNINIPDDLYKKRITREEKFRQELDNFIKNETNYAQLSTKRNFYCIILRIIRIIDHFFNETKKEAVYQSLLLLNRKVQKFYEFFINNLNIYPLLKISILTLGNSIKYIPEFNNLEELFFEKFIQENIFNFINKKNFIDPQEFPIYMTCYEDVFEKSFDQNASLLIRIKEDEQIINLINSIKNYFYKLGDELNKKVEELRNILDNYYKYSKIDFKEFEENCTPTRFQEYLDFVYEEKEKTLKLNKINNIGLFELNIEQLLDLITNAPNKFINKAKKIVPIVLKNKQNCLISLLNENIKELSKEVKNVEGFLVLKNSFENCKNERYKIDEIEAEIGDYIEIINNKKNRMAFDQVNLENQSFLRILNLHYEEIFQKINYDIDNSIKKYKDILILNIKGFQKELEDISNQLNTDLINKHCNNYNDALIELKGLSLKIVSLKEKKDIFLKESGELELEEHYIEIIKRLDTIINEFEMKKEVWEKVKEFDIFKKEYNNKEVIKIDIQYLDETFNQYINLCINCLDNLSNFTVSKTLIDNIMPYKRLLEVIKVIQNPVVQNNEAKFDELKILLKLNLNENIKYLDIYTGTFTEKFTFEALKNLNLNNIETFIEFNKITNEEERLRIFIKNKYDEMNMRKLKYKVKKNIQNTMTYLAINKNIEDNEYEFIEKNIMLLRKESLNPCSSVISTQLNQLLNNYEKYRIFLNLINVYNQKIHEIDGILLSPEFFKEYPSENKKILKENELRYLIKLLQDNKFLSKFFQDNIYNKIISCANILIDSIEKNIYAINRFIDKRRREFPQYYLMNNKEIMYLYNHKKDNIFLTKIIKRIYPWVKDINLNYTIESYGNDEYIKIHTVDDEIILVKNAKGLKDLKDIIDVIYNELIKRMKDHFKAHKKNNEIIYKNKSTKKMNDILKPIINELNGNLLIQEIFICIYYSILDNIEKSLRTNDVFDKIFELYNICKNDIMIEIIKNINDDKNAVNKKKYFCLLSLFNYIIGMLENLMHDDAQSPSDFSFIKYLNPKIESDTLNFYILGNLCSIEYGYEYTGIINNYLLLLSNEKMFIEIMNAFEFYKKPIIINTNYIKAEKDINLNNNNSSLYTYDNIFILGSFLGKNIKEYSCNKNTDVNIFKNILCGYIKYGPWIRFNNIYNLNSIHDFEIISNQIIEVYYQIKHSEEEFITLNDGNKILINNKNFNIIVNITNKDLNNENNVNKSFTENIHHYYRTINYIQPNFEFYMQMNLINLGIKNYEIIMNKILLILKYIYCKVFYIHKSKYKNDNIKLYYSNFIYYSFNMIINKIRNNKIYQIQYDNQSKNNKMDLNSIMIYENNFVYQETKNSIEIVYKNKIDNNIYKYIMYNLEQIFNIIKDDKNKKIDNNKNDNNNEISPEINKIKEEINTLISPYEISEKSNYYNKIIHLYLNLDKFNTFIIFGPPLSGKTTLYYLFLSLIKKIKNTEEFSIKINNLSINPKSTPEFFKNFSEHKILMFFNDNKINRINDILTDFYENDNKSILFTNKYEDDNNEKEENISINSNDSDNSEKIKDNFKKCEKLNILKLNGEISNNYMQFLLNNNEFTLIKEQAINKLFFETYNLRNFDESLLANENFFYLYISNENNNGLTWENIINKYINTECTINFYNNSLIIKSYIKGLFFKYFSILKDFINTNIHSVNNNCISSNYILFNLICFFDSFLNINIKNIETKNDYNYNNKNNKKKAKNKENEEYNIKKYILYIFIFSFSWILKNFINLSFIAKIEQIINDTFKADDLKTPIFDYYINPIKKELDLWTNLINDKDLLNHFIKIDNIDPINNQIIEPLYKEKIVLLYIISNLINNNKSLYLNYLSFPKSYHIMNNFMNDKNYKTLIYNLNSNTEPNSLTNYFDENLYNIHRNIYGDKYGRKIAIFIDDVNTNSTMDEFIIQLLEKRYYFDKNNFDFNFIYNFSLIFLGKKESGIDFPLNNNLWINKVNLINCHTNYNSLFLSIYKTHLDNKFKDYYINNFSLKSTQYINILTKLYSEISENKNNNIQFNFDDIEQIISNILKLNCPSDNENRYLFEKILTRYYFYSISRIIYDNLYNNKDKIYFQQIICSTYNKIFKKVKINVEDIFENNEFLNGKLSDYIFTHIDINNNGIMKEETIYEYKKIDFYKNYINQKLKEFNNGYNDNIYQELIINDADYEYIQNILFFCENNLKNKKILILLEGNKLFKDLLVKFTAFIVGGKIIECKNDILSITILNKLFEEIVLNNKTIFYYIKDNILENDNSFYNIKNILNPNEFIKYIDIKKYNQENDIDIDIDNALLLIKNNLKIIFDIKNYRNIKEISYFKKYNSYILDNSHIIYQANWLKKDYKFYLDYSFSKSNAIKDIKSSSNYVNIKKNLFEIIYNTYLFSCELINKIYNDNNENIILLNNYIDSIQIFLNKYEYNYNIIKEKYFIFENCNPTHKIMNLIKKINNEIYELNHQKDDLERRENNYKKQKQSLFIDRQGINRLITEYEKKIDVINIELLKITDELENSLNPILKNISKYTEDCMSYNEISFNEVKHSYENSNLGKLILVSIYILISNNNEKNQPIWDFTKKNLNVKNLNSFFEKKYYINNVNEKLYIRILENMTNNTEFQHLIKNLNKEKYTKSPFISMKKFCKYFNECYNYYKAKNEIEELNKRKSDLLKDINILNNRKKDEKAKIDEIQLKNVEIESQINSLEKEKNNILFNIKCHNDLMLVTKNFFENLDKIIPELLRKKKIFQDVLTHFVSYHLFLSLYYSFAPIFDRKNRVLLQKYIYNQINKYNKNETKEFTFIEIYYNFLDFIHNYNDNESNKNDNNRIYSKNRNFILSLYQYFDLNKLNINDENSFILENLIFINFFKNRSICLLNNKNPGFSNLLLINIFKEQANNEKNNDNINNDLNDNNNDNQHNNKNNNKLSNNHININVSNNIIINIENGIYQIIEINLNKHKIEKDLEYISKLLNDGQYSRNKRSLILFINNCNKDNMYLFEELINNSDNKKRASIFYLGKNKITMSNQIYFRVFFSCHEFNYNFSINPSIINSKFINFNVNSKLIKNELEIFLGNISDEKYLNKLKENELKLLKLQLEKELHYKNICDIINKYEYETKENNYVNNKKYLTDLELELKKDKTEDFKKTNKNIKLMRDNLGHLNILCTQGGKIYKIIQKYYSSFSFQEFKIIFEKFYRDNGYNEIDKENINGSNLYINKNSSIIRDNEEEEDEENSDISQFSPQENINHIKQYSNNDLSILINYFYENKIQNLLLSSNISIFNYLKINLFFFFLKQNNDKNKINFELYKKIFLDINNLLSNTINIELNEIPPLDIISNLNWNQLIFLSKNNNSIYKQIINNISENKREWEKYLTNSSIKEICNQITKILNDVNNNKVNKRIIDILIIITFICPLRFNEIKEYLIRELYENNLELLENHYTLKGFIGSIDNSFNNNNQKPLIIIESNKENIEQKIQYIKTILYPKLLSLIKITKGLPLAHIIKPSNKISAKISSVNVNNNLNIIEKNVANNIIAIENKENAIKYMIIKENIRNNNYDNIVQYIKTGGLIIINNISKFDKSSINQIINIINDAKNNKYLDRSFRLILTLSEPLISYEINNSLLKNCIYFNVDLFNYIIKSSFKNKILESIKNIDKDVILFFSINIFRKKILINIIFIIIFLQEISLKKYYFNIFEIEKILLFMKKHIENNDSEYKINNNNGIIYYFLFQFIIDNFLISRFTYKDEQSRIKTFIIKMLFDDNFINDNKYLLFFDKGKLIINNNNEEINKQKLFNLFNNITEYDYNNIVFGINKKIIEQENAEQINSFFKNIKYENKQTINILRSSTNIRYINYEEIINIFQEYIQKIPDFIILPLEEEINDDNISKTLFRKEKNNMFLNPLDELLINEVSFFNDEIENLRNKIQALIEQFNKNKYIKEEIFRKIIKENDIENNINYIRNKYDFYKNWIKEGELKKYSLNYIINIKLFFYLLKFKYYRKQISSRLNNEENNIQKKKLEKVLLNFSPIKLNNNSIEISGLSFSLNEKYELLIVDNHLTLSKPKDIKNQLNEDKSFSLFIDFIDEDIKNNNDMNDILDFNQDLPIIKDQYDNIFNYDKKTVSCNFYQYDNNTLEQMNDHNEKIKINISNEVISDMNKIILNEIFIYVKNYNLININQSNYDLISSY